jgi:hypothetical protein
VMYMRAGGTTERTGVGVAAPPRSHASGERQVMQIAQSGARRKNLDFHLRRGTRRSREKKGHDDYPGRRLLVLDGAKSLRSFKRKNSDVTD